MSGKLRALFLTARPKTLSAAVVPVLVATALVHAEGLPVKWWISVCAVLSAIFIQIGTNFLNDAIDFWKGADKETRLGEARAAQSGWFSARAVLLMGFGSLLGALLLGVPLVVEGGWPIFWIGVVSLAMAYAYTGGPWPLAYKGLGDLFVILFFGVIAVGGVYYLQTRTFAASAVVAGLQIGCLATVLIAINNLRDLEQDAKVGKRTLAVRLGPKLGRLEVVALLAFTFALNVFWFRRGEIWAATLPFLSLPVGLFVLTRLFQWQASARYNELLARAALLHMLFGAMLSLGLVFQ
ncbi:MAG TPA: 1,4-dihydroxy-2-naphthoate octaprenyltransferase [Bdellovibrionales bacterium]|nr:1,4-dihydroxy-2-naphthoate octaprenyltransferase [Bdellovibrionales bacterium]